METNTNAEPDQEHPQENVDPMSIESDFKPLTKEELHQRAKWRNYEVKNSVSRSQLSFGIRGYDNEILSMRDSWHESETLAFASGKSKNCSSCKKEIFPFSLYSTGQRYLEPDAPIPVQGRDDVHLKCTGEYRGKTLRDVVQGQDVSSFAGWASLPLESKQKYLYFSGQKVSQELLNKKQAFTGMVSILCGEFSQSKDGLGLLIQQNGGEVLQAPSRNLTHMVLGATGTTAYGQKTGKGSKKYKDSMKYKPTVVDEKWLRDSVARWEKLGVCAIEVPVPKAKPAKATKEPAKATKEPAKAAKEPASKPQAKNAKRKAEEQEEKESQEELKEEENNNKKNAGTKESKKETAHEDKKAKVEPTKTDLDFTEADLQGMKRAELQALCKKHNLRAVGKNEELTARLKELLNK